MTNKKRKHFYNSQREPQRKQKIMLLEIIYSDKVILEDIRSGRRIKFDDRVKMVGFVSRNRLASAIKNLSCLPVHLQNMTWERNPVHA